MTEDEIKGYLHVGREKTVCVERRLYESLKILIESLEKYFGIPLIAWENYTKSGDYPDELLRNNTKGGIKFRQDIKKRAIELPAGTLFKMQKNYWYYI